MRARGAGRATKAAFAAATALALAAAVSTGPCAAAPGGGWPHAAVGVEEAARPAGGGSEGASPLAAAAALAPASALAQEAGGAASPDSSGQQPLPAGLDPASARRTSVARLSAADPVLDDSLVVFRGEAVGEAVASSSPGYRWVLVQSESGGMTCSIQVLMSVDQASQITSFGAYKRKGTTVEVTGVYRIADPNQAGTLDVTAYGVRVVDEGGPVEEDVSMTRVRAGLALAAAGLALSAANILLRRRSRA